MTKADVDYIRHHHDKILKSRETAGSYVIYGNSNDFKRDICFARLRNDMNKIRERSHIQYALFWQEDSDLIDYSALLKELKKILEYRFSIIKYKTKYDNVRIIDLRHKPANYISNPDIRYAITNVLFCMLRGIDGEGYSKLSNRFSGEYLNRAKFNLPFNNWKDFLTFWSIHVGNGGHGINDDLYALGYPLARDESAGRRKLLESAVNNFLNILHTAFGKKFDWEHYTKIVNEGIEKGFKKQRFDYYAGYFKPGNFKGGQTPSFDLIEYVVKSVNNQEKKEEKVE